MTSNCSSLPYFLRINVLKTSSITFINVGRSIFSASLNSWKESIKLIRAINLSSLTLSLLVREFYLFKLLKYYLNFCLFYFSERDGHCLCNCFFPFACGGFDGNIRIIGTKQLPFFLC